MTTDPETRALTAESEALLDRIHILNGRSFPLATREDFAAIEEAARRADEPRVAEGLTEFRALVDEARANHVRWEHEAEVLEECLRPLCIGAKMLLWPDIEDPRSSALPAPRPPEPDQPCQTCRDGAVLDESGRHITPPDWTPTRPPEPDRAAALSRQALGCVWDLVNEKVIEMEYREHMGEVLTDGEGKTLDAYREWLEGPTPEPAPVADGRKTLLRKSTPTPTPPTDGAA